MCSICVLFACCLQIETNKNTALTLACFQGRYEVVSLLVDRKANIEHRAKVKLINLLTCVNASAYVSNGLYKHYIRILLMI